MEIVALYPFFKNYTLPLAVSMGALISFSVRFYYTRKAYRFNSTNKQSKKNYKYSDKFNEFFWPGLSHIVMKLDILILLSIFKFTPQFSFSHKVNEFLLWFLIFPVMQGAFDWIRLMYFDLIKLGRTISSTLSKKFISNIFRYNIDVGLCLSFISLLTIKVFLHKDIGYFWYMIPIFIFSRSFLASMQMILFSQKKYKTLIIPTLLIIISLKLLSLYFYSSFYILGFFCIALNLVSLYFYFFHYKNHLDKISEGPIGLIELTKMDYSEFGILKFSKSHMNNESSEAEWIQEKSWIFDKIEKKMNRILGTNGVGTRLSPRHLAWVSTNKTKFTEKMIIKISQGLSEDIRISKSVPLDIDQKVLSKINSRDESEMLSLKEIEKRFQESIRNGLIINLEDNGRRDLGFDHREEGILNKLKYYLKYLEYKPRKRKQVDCLVSSRGIKRLFIYDRNSQGREKWEKMILDQNILYLLYS